MDFHWSLSDSKSPQVSRTLLSILVDLNNAVVRIVSVRLPLSIFSRPFIEPLAIVPSARTRICITVTLNFHSFFSFLARSKYLSLFSFSLIFTPGSAVTGKSVNRLILFFYR